VRNIHGQDRILRNSSKECDPTCFKNELVNQRKLQKKVCEMARSFLSATGAQVDETKATSSIQKYNDIAA